MRTLIALLFLLCADVANAAFGPAWLAATQRTAASPGGYYGIVTAPYIWFNCESQTYNTGDAVSELTDDSGNNLHAGQSSAALRPTFRTGAINSLPAMYFDGGDCLTNPAVTISSFTYFVVTSNSAASTMLFELSNNAGSSYGEYIITGTGCTIWYHNDGIQTAKDVDADWGINKWMVVRYECAGNNADHLLYTNGTACATSTCASKTGNPGTANITDRLNIGARNNGAGFQLIGHIAEFLVWTPALSDSDADTVESNLRTRYGL